MHTFYFTLRMIFFCVVIILMIVYGASEPKKYIYADDWDPHSMRKISKTNIDDIDANVTTQNTTTITDNTLLESNDNDTGDDTSFYHRRVYIDQDMNENYIEGKNYTIETIGKWILMNKIANQNCEKIVHEETENIIKCVTKEKECQTTQYTIPRLWETNFSSKCMNEVTQQYNDIYGENPTVTQMCQMNALFFVDVFRKEQKQMLPDITKIDVITEIMTSFPINLLWNSKKDVKEVGKNLAEIVESDQLSIRDTAVTLCAMLRPIHSIYYDNKGQSVVLTTGEYNEFNLNLMNILLNIDIPDNQNTNNTDNNNKKDRNDLISKITDAGQQMATHKASLVYFFTSDESKNAIKNWATTTFSWDDNYHPVYIWNSIYRADDIRDILQKVIKNYNSMLTTEEHPVFIIETVEEGIDTVRSAMIRFIYEFDLAKNHQIYFVSSAGNSLEDEITITNYLKKNAWPGVYWINNIIPNRSGKSPVSGRFYGLKQRSPNHYSIKRITKSIIPIENIPSQYDIRNFSPQMKDFMSYVYDQGACGSCWAISASEIIGSSLCQRNTHYCNSQISAQDILSCVGQGTYGCSGAYMGDALLNIQRIGCVSDDCLSYINGDCKDLAIHGSQCQSEGGDFTPIAAACRTTCYNNTLKHSIRYISDVLWLNAGYRSTNSIKLTERIIQEHIMTTGPVIAGIEVFRDFEDFNQFDKVYTHSYDPRSSILGGHAIILIGWGVGEDIRGRPTPYWLAKNSWGSSWGKDGLFKIVRGSLRSPYVEDEVYGVNIFDNYSV